MKRTLSLLLTAVLALTCIFAFSGCGKKPLDIYELQDILEKEGFEVYVYDDEYDYEYDIDYKELYAYNDDIDIEFMEYDENNENFKRAINDLDDDYEEAMSDIPDEAKVFTNKKTKDYLCLEAAYDGDYLFAARIENTLIVCECDEEYMKDAQRILKKIGCK